MTQIRDKILTIHHSLNENPMADTTLFYEFIEQWDRKVIYHRYERFIIFISILIRRPLPRQPVVHEVVKDITKYISTKDYIYIDKLYIKLHNRKPNLTGDELKTYNKDCARLAENALTTIPWKNYI